jgi:hypothetical protein
MHAPFRALAATILLAAAGFAAAPAAQADESHVYFHNKSDAWVWVTVYKGLGMIDGRALSVPSPARIYGAYCVAPGAYDQHGLRTAIYEVRAEVTHHGCSHPVMLDQLRGFPYGNGHASNVMTYYVHGKNGHYVYNNTP